MGGHNLLSTPILIAAGLPDSVTARKKDLVKLQLPHNPGPRSVLDRVDGEKPWGSLHPVG